MHVIGMFRHPVWNKRQIDIVFTSMESCDSMTGAEQPRRPSEPHRVFYGPSELRAGWRLFIFLAIVSAMIIATNRVVRLLLPGADATTLFLVFQVINFLIFLSASWVIWRIEVRTIPNYVLPCLPIFPPQS